MQGRRRFKDSLQYSTILCRSHLRRCAVPFGLGGNRSLPPARLSSRYAGAMQPLLHSQTITMRHRAAHVATDLIDLACCASMRFRKVVQCHQATDAAGSLVPDTQPFRGGYFFLMVLGSDAGFLDRGLVSGSGHAVSAKCATWQSSSRVAPDDACTHMPLATAIK
jgi:hypothetical protein